MLAAALFATCLLAAAGAAPNNAAKVSTSIDSKQTCITKVNDGSSSPASLPTSTQTSSQTISSTITTCGTLSTITTTITPAAVTSTRYVNGTFLGTTLSKAPVNHVQACSTTTTVSASAVTVYTGSYNGTVAKRTAAPLNARFGNAHPRFPVNFNMFHQLGQVAVDFGQKAFAIYCLEEVTTYLLKTTTIAEEPATETVTAGVPTVVVTQANKAASQPTAPVPITSTITAPGAANATAANGACAVTVASSTTTQHLKCAPTNLIGSVNGYGIGQTGGSSNTTRGLAPGSDPSACCQLCVDTEGCAASEDDPDAGNCFLWYTKPSCGLGFQYSTGSKEIEPGTGFLVQTGCGTIEGVDSFE